MKKRKSLLFVVTFLLQITFSEAAFAQVMTMEADTIFKSKAAEIKDKNPRIPEYVLHRDIGFLKENFQKTNFAKMNLPSEILMNVTADAWEDIRVKNVVGPMASLNSVSLFNRYGILKVNSRPKKGATIILNQKETWDKKTDAYKGVPSGSYLVEIKLEGYWAKPKKAMVPESDGITLDFELKKK